MPKAIPLTVMPDSVNSDSWRINVGRSQQRVTNVFGRKREAIEQAERFAHEDRRPGVAVYDSDGEFQRFIVSPIWFENHLWEHI